jgi:Lon protease-like protein
MKKEHGFVVALISSGKEVDDLPEIYSTGTYVEITDWKTLDNTLLGITVTGIQRVNILSTQPNTSGLITAETKDFNTSLKIKNLVEFEGKFNNLVETLKQLSDHPFISDNYSDIDYSSSINVCYLLSELLPVSNTTKQDLLETNNINSYIDKLTEIIKALGGY